jgi:hypothetical protein
VSILFGAHMGERVGEVIVGFAHGVVEALCLSLMPVGSFCIARAPSWSGRPVALIPRGPPAFVLSPRHYAH